MSSHLSTYYTFSSPTLLQVNETDKQPDHIWFLPTTARRSSSQSDALVRILARHLGFYVQYVPGDGDCAMHAFNVGSGFLRDSCRNSEALRKAMDEIELPWPHDMNDTFVPDRQPYIKLTNGLHDISPQCRLHACAALKDYYSRVSTKLESMDMLVEIVHRGTTEYTYQWDVADGMIPGGFFPVEFSENDKHNKRVTRGQGLQHWFQIHKEPGK